MPEAYTTTGQTFYSRRCFADTAATIVSGAVAERIKINGYLIFTIIFVALIYPVIRSWKWGGLDAYGFYDFAGSSVPLAIMGVFMIWFGWFGFNGGSVLSANP